jgi:hypothetical protein
MTEGHTKNSVLTCQTELFTMGKETVMCNNEHNNFSVVRKTEPLLRYEYSGRNITQDDCYKYVCGREGKTTK